MQTEEYDPEKPKMNINVGISGEYRPRPVSVLKYRFIDNTRKYSQWFYPNCNCVCMMCLSNVGLFNPKICRLCARAFYPPYPVCLHNGKVCRGYVNKHMGHDNPMVCIHSHSSHKLARIEFNDGMYHRMADHLRRDYYPQKPLGSQRDCMKRACENLVREIESKCVSPAMSYCLTHMVFGCVACNTFKLPHMCEHRIGSTLVRVIYNA